MSRDFQRRPLPRSLSFVLTVSAVALAGIVASTFPSTASADHTGPLRDGTRCYHFNEAGRGNLTIRQVLNQGFKVVFRCIEAASATPYPETVKATGKLTVTPRVKRALGLRSTVIAGGTFTRGGPTSNDPCTVEAQKCRYYTLRIPRAASLRATFKKKRVGHIRVHPQATLTYTSADGTPANYTFTEHRFDSPLNLSWGPTLNGCAKLLGNELWYGCKFR